MTTAKPGTADVQHLHLLRAGLHSLSLRSPPGYGACHCKSTGRQGDLQRPEGYYDDCVCSLALAVACKTPTAVSAYGGVVSDDDIIESDDNDDELGSWPFKQHQQNYSIEGRPDVGADLLLSRLRKYHGPDGRPDLYPRIKVEAG